MQALIDLKNVYKIYNPGENEVRALDGVTLSILSGEFIAVIGHSGSGKSTLMNIIGCLDVPSRGEYLLKGEKVEKMNDKKLSEIRNRQIGFIFQNFNLIPSLTAIENVELPLIYRGLQKSERHYIAKKALERVGLSKRMDHRPFELSGGQQQRVSIARAIAARPPVILADEPTGNLDSRSGFDIMSILRELNEDGRTIVLITHDNTVAASAKRVISINDGHINDNLDIESRPCC
jgi:putative ABC transport system ATP-binding protein